MDFIDYYINKPGRLITFALERDMKFYNVLTIIEAYPEGMPVDRQFAPNINAHAFCARTKAPGKKDKVYLGIEEIIVSKNLLTDPQNHSVFNGVNIYNLTQDFQSFYTDWIQLPDSSSEIASLLPSRMTSVKAHIWKPTEIPKDEMDILMNAKISSQLRELSQGNLGYDITQYHSLYGSYITACYTPIYRNLRFKANSDKTGLYCRIDYRTADHPILKFKIQTHTRENTPLETKNFESSGEFLNLFKFDHSFHHIDISITDDFDNTIDHYESMNFISSIHFTPSIKTKDVKYIDENGNSKIVEKFVEDSTTIIGKEETLASLFNSSPEFTYEQFEKSLDFIFFDGDKNDIDKNVKRAKECILKILNGAHKTCYICDIFFSAATFTTFLLDLINLNTNVRIISSKENLNKDDQKKLHDLIKKSNEEVGHNIECRLLRGDKAALHDRIIVADDNVWMIGCSLDEFGVRATSLIRVPAKYAPKIISGVEKWWNDDNFTEKLA